MVTGLIESISRAEYEVLFTGHNMTEIVFVLQSVYDVELRKVRGILRDLLDNPGFEFVPGYHAEELLTLWPSRIRDYGDAVFASAATVLGARVVTVDRAFARALDRLELNAGLW